MFPWAEQLALPAFPHGLPAAPFSHSKGSLTLAKTHCHLRARHKTFRSWTLGQGSGTV